MELFIFNRKLELLRIFESYYSFRWVRNYHTAGTFELHCALNKETLELFKIGNIIWKKGDIEGAYITHLHMSQSSDGIDTLSIQGNFLTGLLGDRIVWGTETLKTTTELAMRTLVNNNAINPKLTDRKLEMFKLGEEKGYKDEIDYQVSYNNLLVELEELSVSSDIGFRTMLDIYNKKLIFDVYKGVDRTVSQSQNAPAIFSREFENVLEQNLTNSTHNYRNIALVAGEGEGVERKLTTVGGGVGWDRKELFVDARDLQTEKEDGSSITEKDYIEILKQRGETRLGEYAKLDTFECKLNIHSNMQYKLDFDIGDLVTYISKAWGISIDTRITSIEEIYEPDGFNVYVTVGNPIPTLRDKIKQSRGGF